jgi:hypothetical protein
MPEGLSPSEVGKELAEHRHKAEEKENSLILAPKPPV